MWGATDPAAHTWAAWVFQSTLPVWGATLSGLSFLVILFARFQSTLPVWGATRFRHTAQGLLINFNPRSPCGERRRHPAVCKKAMLISIHAPRVGSDTLPLISSRMLYTFQSTLPVWGATLAARPGSTRTSYFNPRSPCGERLRKKSGYATTSNFNPRSPCGERPTYYPHHPGGADFNPRSPCGERQWLKLSGYIIRKFQSTLPVWGATIIATICRVLPQNFNPRSPCGERHKGTVLAVAAGAFQSTLPVWGATGPGPLLGRGGGISIHAPRVGSDGPPDFHAINIAQYFNPRSPCGERPRRGNGL